MTLTSPLLFYIKGRHSVVSQPQYSSQYYLHNNREVKSEIISCNKDWKVWIENILTALQLVHQLLLLLEDVLEFTQGGLHLLQRELVLALRRLVLSHPGVELGDGVVQQNPLLHPL